MTTEKKWYATFAEYLDKEYAGPKMATDALIRYPIDGLEGLVLGSRKYAPLGLSPIGGIAEYMTFEENVVKESLEESGLKVYLDTPTWRPFGVFSGLHDDSRAFIATVVYTGAGYGTIRARPDEDLKETKVYRICDVKEMLARPNIWASERHRHMVDLYIAERYANGDRAWNEPIRH